MLGFRRNLKNAFTRYNYEDKEGALKIIDQHIELRDEIPPILRFLTTHLPEFFKDLEKAKEAVNSGNKKGVKLNIINARKRMKSLETLTNKLRQVESQGE